MKSERLAAIRDGSSPAFGTTPSIDTGNWWYEAVTANVGVYPVAEIPADFFIRSEPVDEYLQRAYLR